VVSPVTNHVHEITNLNARVFYLKTFNRHRVATPNGDMISAATLRSP
jgi:hypothetical protein